MKKFTLSRILLSIIAILLIYSCKKDLKQIFNTDEKPEIQWAKD